VIAIINFFYFSKETQINRLLQSTRFQDKKRLIPFGCKIYSQDDDDGIIREIFNRIGTTNKIFVEFGVGDGLCNNTLALLFDGWKGTWIEASAKKVRKIKSGLKKTLSTGQLSILQAFVSRENIDQLISSQIREKEIDLLSVDIDGNDFHVLEQISCISPRAIVIEYNAKFPPPLNYCMAYEESHIWNGSDNFGASLKFLEIQLKKKGYLLVGCNLTGINAFFVREDLVSEKFLSPFTAENHYEPARYYLAHFKSGHHASYETLEKRLL
jgi:hypothetical protein